MPTSIGTAVVLETMWGTPGSAPGWFRINPQNHSGKRLFTLLGAPEVVWVTNCCREQVGHATHHGVPDVDWLIKNLKRVEFDRLLLCGKVAQETFARIGLDTASVLRGATVFRLPHPAARNWTKQLIQEWKEKLKI